MIKKTISTITFLSLLLLGFSAQTKNSGHGQNSSEEPAPPKCGALHPCIDGERVYMYSCSGNNVNIRFCGEKSTFKIGDENQCVGPEKKLSKEMFMNFVKVQINRIKFSDKGEVLSPMDIEAAKSTSEVIEERSCSSEIEKELMNARNKLELLGDVLSYKVKDELRREIGFLERDLIGKKSSISICENKDGAIRKINELVQSFVADICNKGMHVPKSGSFMNKVLSQYDPSKHPCDSVKDCAEDVKLKDTKVVGSIINRTFTDSGVVEEYVIDNESKLVWGPIAPNKLKFEDAKKHCESLNSKNQPPLGKKSWHLPTIEEFRVAFNPSNADRSDTFINKQLVEAMPHMYHYNTWISHTSSDGSPWALGGVLGQASKFSKDSVNSFRCVAL